MRFLDLRNLTLLMLSQFSGKHFANAAPSIICCTLAITLSFFTEKAMWRIRVGHQFMSDPGRPQFPGNSFTLLGREKAILLTNKE